jgi:AcrR family transcriptional regulator
VNSHSVTQIQNLLRPRKTPVQARSTSTVEAIFTATIQVLIEFGLKRLTTTRVAERAGASVGTLYQYFPNKSALLAAVLEKHLVQVVEAVESACQAAKGKSLDDIAKDIVTAFVSAKLREPKTSMALYAVAAEVGGTEVVARMTQRSQLALCDVLACASDAKFDDTRTVSFVLTTAMVGPVQGLLAMGAPALMARSVTSQLVHLATAYLRACSVKPKVNTDAQRRHNRGTPPRRL